MRADDLIRELELKPHPEGGHYREIYRSTAQVGTRCGARAALTTIYFLLRRGDISEFHRVSADEVWHHLEGEGTRLISVSEDLQKVLEFELGPVSGSTRPVAVIERNCWQAANPTGDYSLISCSVAPGFEFSDFYLMRDDPAVSAQLKARYPSYATFVR